MVDTDSSGIGTRVPRITLGGHYYCISDRFYPMPAEVEFTNEIESVISQP